MFGENRKRGAFAVPFLFAFGQMRIPDDEPGRVTSVKELLKRLIFYGQFGWYHGLSVPLVDGGPYFFAVINLIHFTGEIYNAVDRT